MKNFSDFISKSTKSLQTVLFDLDSNQIRENYIAGNIFNEGNLVEKINTGEIGKIMRRGSNHLICVTENGNMFKAWITDVREVYEVGTCAYRKYVQKYTPGQPIKPFSGKIKIKSSYK